MDKSVTRAKRGAYVRNPPEVLEPVRRQRRVDRRAGDRPMPEPALAALAEPRPFIISHRSPYVFFAITCPTRQKSRLDPVHICLEGRQNEPASASMVLAPIAEKAGLTALALPI
jgi:hypothetical protein